MIELGAAVLLIPLDVLPPSSASPSTGVYPQQSHGFAAYIVGGFIGLGVIILAMILFSTKPKRADPTRDDQQSDQ
jgi:hypothetical protein